VPYGDEEQMNGEITGVMTL